MDLMDHYMISYLLLLIALVECVSVGWVFRLEENVARVGRGAVAAHLVGFFLGTALFVSLLVGPMKDGARDKLA